MVPDVKISYDYAEIQALTECMCQRLSMESIKDIAREAYASNTIATRPLIKELYRKTKHRYIKAVYLLWKYKVYAPNGQIILSRIGKYCDAKLSNKYIDLCIYKDIFEQIRKSNSSFLNRTSTASR